ncbi:MAG: hypothetical protein V7K35_02715 [Nostoc sp.]
MILYHFCEDEGNNRVIALSILNEYRVKAPDEQCALTLYFGCGMERSLSGVESRGGQFR